MSDLTRQVTLRDKISNKKELSQSQGGNPSLRNKGNWVCYFVPPQVSVQKLHQVFVMVSESESEHSRESLLSGNSSHSVVKEETTGHFSSKGQ